MLIVFEMQRYGKNSKPPNTLLIIMLKCINKKSHNRDFPIVRNQKRFNNQYLNIALHQLAILSLVFA